MTHTSRSRDSRCVGVRLGAACEDLMGSYREHVDQVRREGRGGGWAGAGEEGRQLLAVRGGTAGDLTTLVIRVWYQLTEWRYGRVRLAPVVKINNSRLP